MKYEKHQKVIVREGYSAYRYELHTVISVGEKTGQVTLENGERFHEKGAPIGSRKFSTRVLLPATEQLLQQAIRATRIEFLRGYQWHDASDTILSLIVELMRKQGVVAPE